MCFLFIKALLRFRELFSIAVLVENRMKQTVYSEVVKCFDQHKICGKSAIFRYNCYMINAGSYMGNHDFPHRC